MSKSFIGYSVLPVLFLAVVLSSADSVQAEGGSLYRTLSLGASGQDVLQLQKALNHDPSTAIAVKGPGSPGQETSYYGALTAAAVSRFQEKYYMEILAPNGLSSGTGIVGHSTLEVLNEVIAAGSNPQSAVSQPVPPQVSTVPMPAPLRSGVPTATALTSSVQSNPNLKNLDVFLADVDKVFTQKHVSPSTVAIIKAQIMKDIATTTDLRKEFERAISQSITRRAPSTSLAALWGWVVKGFSHLVAPSKAFAQGAGSAFGGRLLYSFYCDCSDSWLVTLEPLPPDYVALLSYEEGTQAYLSYNIPFTEWLLGKYEEGDGICEEYIGEGCASIPAEGIILPMTGSSPTP